MPETPELLLPESALPELIALDDAVLETLAVVEQSTPPPLLNAYRRVVQRQVAAHIEGVAHIDSPPEVGTDGSQIGANRNPRTEGIQHENVELIHKVLGELTERDREVLTRFYLSEQSEEEICRAMSLTEVQFRLLKSQAKARFSELGKRKLSGRVGRLEVTLDPGHRRVVEMNRVVPLIARAIAVFGDETKASHWLCTPLPLLGDQTPAQVLERPQGIEQVEQILTRIEHNIPS
jgi:putative toxin-antitoxin system antitoxin component (TIGR02293 family)